MDPLQHLVDLSLSDVDAALAACVSSGHLCCTWTGRRMRDGRQAGRNNTCPTLDCALHMRECACGQVQADRRVGALAAGMGVNASFLGAGGQLGCLRWCRCCTTALSCCSRVASRTMGCALLCCTVGLRVRCVHHTCARTYHCRPAWKWSAAAGGVV
jgi:hypothetical protein